MTQPRHAAALTLVVWYLLSPPFSKKDQYGHQHADPSAPLTEWNFYHKNDGRIFDRAHALEFRTSDECERLTKDFHDAWFGKDGRVGVKDQIAWDTVAIDARSESIQYETCLSSDDPLLKEK